MNREPILITATYSGVLQLWNTKDKTWKTKAITSPTGNYVVNKLCIDEGRRYLAAGCTDVVKFFDISGECFKKVLPDVKSGSNVTALGRHFILFYRLCEYRVQFLGMGIVMGCYSGV